MYDGDEGIGRDAGDGMFFGILIAVAVAGTLIGAVLILGDFGGRIHHIDEFSADETPNWTKKYTCPNDGWTGTLGQSTISIVNESSGAGPLFYETHMMEYFKCPIDGYTFAKWYRD